MNEELKKELQRRTAEVKDVRGYWEARSRARDELLAECLSRLDGIARGLVDSPSTHAIRELHSIVSLLVLR